MARIAFLGTPEVAAHTLATLAGAGHQIVQVVTQPDKRRGRGTALAPSPVAAVAEELGLAVSHRASDVLTCGAEIGVVVAYGRIIRRELLEEVPMVNLHFSLLPRWRGAAPVERAILAGDTETGVCLMEVAPELDAGGVYRSAVVAIDPDESADQLRGRLGVLGEELVLAALADLPGSLGVPVPQRGEVTWAAKIEPFELRLDWALPADQIARVVRVGRAWTGFREQRLVVWRARPVEGTFSSPPGTLEGCRVETGDGVIELIEVQPAGKRRMTAAEWLRGAHPSAGEMMGTGRS